MYSNVSREERERFYIEAKVIPDIEKRLGELQSKTLLSLKEKEEVENLNQEHAKMLSLLTKRGIAFRNELAKLKFFK